MGRYEGCEKDENIISAKNAIRYGVDSPRHIRSVAHNIPAGEGTADCTGHQRPWDCSSHSSSRLCSRMGNLLRPAAAAPALQKPGLGAECGGGGPISQQR